MNLTSIPTETLVKLESEWRAARGALDLAWVAARFGTLVAGALQPLASAECETGAAVLSAALAERRSAPTIDLVWSGPEATTSYARSTAVVLEELFASAEKSVLLAGYSFDHSEDIFKALFERMSDRGVVAWWFVHVDPPRSGGDPTKYVEASKAKFLEQHWPFGSPFPDLYFDLRTLDASARASLHAKCVVVDERDVLIGSANFTNRAHTRNIELGVRVRDKGLAKQIGRQFFAGVTSGIFEKI